MARARNIKPGFFRNADLVELPYEARLLFIGLWTLADREGRLADRPKQIKMEIFPADSVDCDALIQSIADTGMLLRYQVGSDRFLQIVNFCKHQNPHRDEKASVIPDPCKQDGIHDAATHEHGASTVLAPCNGIADTVPIGLNPDSLIPDSRFPDGEAHAVPDPTPEPPAMDRGAPDGAARAGPTMAATVCKAIKAEGIASVNPSHPLLATLIAAGADGPLFAAAARSAARQGKGFAWVLGAVQGQMRDAAQAASDGLMLPPSRDSPPEPAWRAEQRQRTAQAVPGIAAKPGADWPKKLIESEVFNGPAIAMG